MNQARRTAEVKIAMLIAGLLALALTACGGPAATPSLTKSGPPIAVVTPTPTSVSMPLGLGDVIGVSVSGTPGDYSLSVTVDSVETGCDSYVDWWEVVSEEGGLIYRRILLHSHVDEQPFTRAGGPVDIQANDTVIIRAHLSDKGYGGGPWKGTVADGFAPTVLDPGFAADLETQGPLPTGCAF